MNQDLFFDRIEAYLFWQMNEQEQANFEQELAENPALAKSWNCTAWNIERCTCRFAMT